MAEVCAERGYAQASVAEVAKLAGVSSVTFYKQFAGKQACMLAAHRQLLGRLLEEVDRACREKGGREARARATIRSVLALFAADPPSARLLTVEILAAGPAGAKCHDAMVEGFGRRLRMSIEPRDAPPLSPVEWARVAGMFALIGKLAVAGEAARLPDLAEEFVAMGREIRRSGP
jgi:AcrR family transcriptional regulator